MQDLKIEEIKKMTSDIIRGVNIKGYDREDLFLEGVLSGIKAKEDFDETKGVKLSTFVYTSIKYRMYYLSRQAKAKKRNPDVLINWELTLIEESGIFYGKELVEQPSQEVDYVTEELRREIIKLLEKELDEKDKKIFFLILEGYSTKEIAKELEYDPRKLANKISYIRRKLKKQLKNKGK